MTGPRPPGPQVLWTPDAMSDAIGYLLDFGPEALLWIGYIFLDDFGRTKPAFLNSTGVMYPSVECILKLLYQCT